MTLESAFRNSFEPTLIHLLSPLDLPLGQVRHYPDVEHV